MFIHPPRSAALPAACATLSSESGKLCSANRDEAVQEVEEPLREPVLVAEAAPAVAFAVACFLAPLRQEGPRAGRQQGPQPVRQVR